MQLIYNILLVDDEPMHLAGLSNMFHKLRPHYAVYTARNGKEALSFCTEESFQIIITDIQMPMMDGLEFIGSLGDDNNPRKVIFLSGYGNFDYAQKAIGLGSFDYLLKPLDVDQFTHVLEKAERSIETEVRLLEEKRQMEQKLQRVFPVYHQRILNGWLKGEADTPAKQTEVEDILGFGGAGRLLLTDIAYDASRIPQPEASSCKMKIKDAIGDLIGDYGRFCSFFLDQDGSRLITATDAPLSATVLEALSGISEAVEIEGQTGGLRMSIGISVEAANIALAGPRLAAQARHACEGRFYEPGRRVFLGVSPDVFGVKQPQPKVQLPSPHGSKDAALLTGVLHNGDVRERESFVCGMFERIAAPGWPEPGELLRYIAALFAEAVDTPEFLGQDELRSSLLEVIDSRLKQSADIEDLKKNAVSVLGTIADRMRELKTSRKEALIQHCLAYIDEHYMEDLSLESVSAVFHFSSSYFSNYFKSKMNINFSLYLTQIRLAKAKELLEGSNDKVYQIAAKLGYQDVKYFNRVFKKEFSLTPEEYRTISRSMTRR